MKKGTKWGLFIGGGLIILIIAVLIAIPFFIDIRHYKPQIEKQVAKATGRSFSMGDDMSLSLFPWAGISLSDLRLGNPKGFKEKDFVTVKSFEVRVKLLPLLSKDVQVKRFILKGPRIVLVKKKNGKTNWEDLGKPKGEAPKKERKPEKEAPSELPLKSLVVGKFAVTEGSALWIDHAAGMRKEVSDLTLHLKDVSFEKPIKIDFSAKVDKQPVSLKGAVGPLGKELGKGTIPIDLTVKALNELDMMLKGKLINPVGKPKFDLAVNVSPFSPKKMMSALGQKFPVETADAKALDKVSLKVKAKGDTNNVSISDGVLGLDESTMKFSMSAKNFKRPNIAFDVDLDKIDVDRYLPPPSEEKPAKTKAAAPAKKKKTDYAPLRRLTLDGKFHAGNIKASNAKIEDLNLKVVGKNGVFRLDPLSMKLYEGTATVKGNFDVRQDVPRSDVNLDVAGVQVGPLIKDVKKKDILEGGLKMNAALRMSGDEPERIKRTLNGKGEMVFTDGAIIGVDLAGMVRNVKATFGLAEKGAERPKTDFAEMRIPFTITNGLVNISGTELKSPLLRVSAKGNANLVNEALNMRIEPKVVGSLKGQGDTKARSGLTVPVIVAGTFSSPSFRPDLSGMVQQNLKGVLSEPTKVMDSLPGLPGTGTGQETTGTTTGTESGAKSPLGTVEEKAKELFKLPFGR